VVTVAKGWPLSDEEYEVLDEFLASIEDADPMTLEELDGFFCALVAGPELVPPSEFLPEVFGGDFPEFKDMEEAQRITGLLMRHWNGIADTLAKDEIHLPYVNQEEDGSAPANEWACGFMTGISMRDDSWSRLIKDDDHAGAILPMMILCHEHDEDPEMRPGPITPEKRKELLAYMAAGTLKIYQYFKADREAYRSPFEYDPVKRSGPKIGRNEPCPCGSGKKYKKCCGA
jgi:uncharacterized protein